MTDRIQIPAEVMGDDGGVTVVTTGYCSTHQISWWWQGPDWREEDFRKQFVTAHTPNGFLTEETGHRWSRWDWRKGCPECAEGKDGD